MLKVNQNIPSKGYTSFGCSSCKLGKNAVKRLIVEKGYSLQQAETFLNTSVPKKGVTFLKPKDRFTSEMKTVFYSHDQEMPIFYNRLFPESLVKSIDDIASLPQYTQEVIEKAICSLKK